MAAQAAHTVLNGRFDARILDVGCGTGKVLEDVSVQSTYATTLEKQYDAKLTVIRRLYNYGCLIKSNSSSLSPCVKSAS